MSLEEAMYNLAIMTRAWFLEEREILRSRSKALVKVTRMYFHVFLKQTLQRVQLGLQEVVHFRELVKGTSQPREIFSVDNRRLKTFLVGH